ncbi:tRNA pseudouridine(13) synthase TruD [Anatilimnocola floriformis]|uniref:tRNA pseudouridine(13) synthase TruD n=1 Tax=Anatilimnocola floriformis TaxID=2948575 RepID=UPI0020C44C8F|nr:tRNA pseudouridine(13) synthase TruD [Anatilimnocola floriformis]
MKLKCIPADFQVDELITSLRSNGGGFALYLLTKQSIGTLEAIDHIVNRWNIPRSQIAWAGLKDRHARTSQYVTIKGGPRQGMQAGQVDLKFLGYATRPVHPRDIVSNRFTVVIRDMDAAEITAAKQTLAEAERDGLPNYFDEQRFGSLGESGVFIAQPWCKGDYEKALWLALAEHNVHDRPDEREQKKILREHWGKWPEAKAALARSHTRSVITYLADKPIKPDFKRALALVRQDLRSLWLAAYQSHLWNQMLAAVLEANCRPEDLKRQRIARQDLPFFTALPPEHRGWMLDFQMPLPSARLHLEPGDLKDLIDDVMQAEGMELREVRVKFPRDAFFSRGERPAIFRPEELQHDTAPDELYPGRSKLTLKFTLRRGSYATIFVKRITGLAMEAEEEEEETPAEGAE